MILDPGAQSRRLLHRPRRRKENGRRRFWKGFAIFIAVTLVVAIVEALCVYNTNGGASIVKT